MNPEVLNSQVLHSPATAGGLPQTLQPCALCGSQNFTEKYGPILRCRGCGLGMVNPLQEFRGENESEEYFLHDYLPLHLASRSASFQERHAHLEAMARQFPLPARPRLLDVGCALGFLLEVAKSTGWEPQGVETSEFAARYARENTGCAVFAGTLQQAAFPSETFDVVTLMDVIEHVPRPSALLAEVYRVLRPGGVVYLVTPNFCSFFVRLYGLHAYGIWPDQHVIYFARPTMLRLLRETGFRRPVAYSKDFYAPNLQRLLWKQTRMGGMKVAFAERRWLLRLRSAVNFVFRRIPLGDKLIACAQKPNRE